MYYVYLKNNFTLVACRDHNWLDFGKLKYWFQWDIYKQPKLIVHTLNTFVLVSS